MDAVSNVVSPPGRLRLDHIDGVRAVAALVVFWNHAYAQVSSGNQVQLHGLFSWSRASMVAGHLSVTVFIVLSGFCLTLPVIQAGGALRGGVAGFLKRRARRILPPYYAAVALCLLLIWTIIGKPTGSLWDFPIAVSTTAIVSHLFLLQDLIATSRINYVFWSVAVEWQIYFMVPILVWAWQRFGATRVVLVTLALGYAARVTLADTRLVRAHPQFLGMFTLGMLAAYLARSTTANFVHVRKRVPWLLGAVLAFSVTVVCAYVWGVRVSESRFFILDLPVGLMAASLLVATSGPEPTAATRVLSWRPLVAVGTFSYSFYLIHAPLLQVLWLYLLRPLGLSREAMLACLMSGGLVLVLLASYAFFRVFEAPFMRSAAAGPRPSAMPAAS